MHFNHDVDTTAIVPGSIADLARQQGGVITPPDVIVLFDISDSMVEEDAKLLDGRTVTRWEAGCEQLALLQRRMPGRIALLAFGDEVEMRPNGVPPEPNGFTNLAGALRKAREADSGKVRFVVISDGAPDSIYAAMEAAREFKGRIDTIAIGRYHGGADFLQELAQATGGTFYKDASEMRALADGMVRMLTSDEGPTSPGGRPPIAL